MPEHFRNQIERLQRLNAVIRHKMEVGEAVAEEIHALVERLSRADQRHIDRLVLGRAARVTAYDDPQLDDSGQVWIPALSCRDGLGTVLVDVHEYGYLVAREVPLDSAVKNQVLHFEDCTALMRESVLEQADILIDRFLAIILMEQS